MAKVAGLLVALLIAGIVTTRAHGARSMCPGTTTSTVVHKASH